MQIISCTGLQCLEINKIILTGNARDTSYRSYPSRLKSDLFSATKVVPCRSELKCACF